MAKKPPRAKFKLNPFNKMGIMDRLVSSAEKCESENFCHFDTLTFYDLLPTPFPEVPRLKNWWACEISCGSKDGSSIFKGENDNER